MAAQSCNKRSKKKNIIVSYEEFSKIAIPKGQIYPLKDGKRSFLLMRLKDDSYSKIYELDHSSKKLSLKLDAGRDIHRLKRDPTFQRFYFAMDDKGNELYKIFSWDPISDKFKRIFGHEGASARIVDFSLDGQRIYMLSNHEDHRIFRLYRFSIKSRKTEALSTPGISLNSVNVDNAENYAALLSFHGNNQTALYLLDLNTKKMKRLLLERGSSIRYPFFDTRRHLLYFTTNRGKDRYGCAYIDYKKPGPIKWKMQRTDKDTFCIYNDFHDFTVVNERFDGRRRLRFYEGLFNKEVKIPVPDRSFPGQFTKVPGKDMTVILISKANSPGEYYITDFSSKNEAKLKRISDLNDSGIKESDMGESFDLFYKSSGGVLIHGIFFAKKQWTLEQKKRPVIFWIHGGPDSYVKHSFHPLIQFAVLNGFIVFAPNFRGSLGYGKRFETLNDGDWAGKDIEDIMKGMDELKKLPYVDPSNMYIMGVSFGGFLTLSTLARHREEFNAACAILPITDLKAFLMNMPGDTGRVHEFYKEIGDPRKDMNLITSRSPINEAEKIKTPLLIFSARNDSRISNKTIIEFVNKMKALELPVFHTEIKNDGHTLNKSSSWKLIFERTLNFFNDPTGYKHP